MELQRATLYSEIQMGHVTNQGPLLVLGPTGSNSLFDPKIWLKAKIDSFLTFMLILFLGRRDNVQKLKLCMYFFCP